MNNRPKYYIGRSFLIYFLTLLTGTIISSFILSHFGPFGSISSNYAEELLAYNAFGMMATSVLCIPILFMLIFGFWFIYSRYENEQKKWKGLIILSTICIIIPLGMTLLIAATEFRSWKALFPWVLVMIAYALSGMFFILFISYKADIRNPPGEMQKLPEFEDILDSGLDDGF